MITIFLAHLDLNLGPPFLLIQVQSDKLALPSNLMKTTSHRVTGPDPDDPVRKVNFNLLIFHQDISWYLIVIFYIITERSHQSGRKRRRRKKLEFNFEITNDSIVPSAF
jgi:hypothetical protein